MKEKKIAIITANFGGTTLPLAKHFADAGYHVDFYASSSPGKFKGLEATEIEPFETSNGLCLFPKGCCDSLQEYLGPNVNLLCCTFSRPYLSVPILRNIRKLRLKMERKRICNIINNRNYDFALIVTQYFTDQFIDHIRFLKCKTFTILHEVVNHLNPDYEHSSPLLKYLFKNNKHIILHSDNSFRDIQNYKDCNKSLLHRVNFGLFETFNTLKNNHTFNISGKYLLYFGVIRPYKGLSILYNAVIQHPECLNGYKIVIAGSGSCEVLPLMKSNENFIVINQFLSNSEVVELAEGASALLCPYLSVSQSGIPQTMYVFKKPIIASDLDGFKEIVSDGVNGLLFHVGDCESLARKISIITKVKGQVEALVKGVEVFDKTYPEYNWDNIVKKYIQIAEKYG